MAHENLPEDSNVDPAKVAKDLRPFIRRVLSPSENGVEGITAQKASTHLDIDGPARGMYYRTVQDNLQEAQQDSQQAELTVQDQRDVEWLQAPERTGQDVIQAIDDARPPQQ